MLCQCEKNKKYRLGMSLSVKFPLHVIFSINTTFDCHDYYTLIIKLNQAQKLGHGHRLHTSACP